MIVRDLVVAVIMVAIDTKAAISINKAEVDLISPALTQEEITERTVAPNREETTTISLSSSPTQTAALPERIHLPLIMMRDQEESTMITTEEDLVGTTDLKSQAPARVSKIGRLTINS
jgi:hypothetical protein